MSVPFCKFSVLSTHMETLKITKGRFTNYLCLLYQNNNDNWLKKMLLCLFLVAVKEEFISVQFTVNQKTWNTQYLGKEQYKQITK